MITSGPTAGRGGGRGRGSGRGGGGGRPPIQETPREDFKPLKSHSPVEELRWKGTHPSSTMGTKKIPKDGLAESSTGLCSILTRPLFNPPDAKAYWPSCTSKGLPLTTGLRSKSTGLTILSLPHHLTSHYGKNSSSDSNGIGPMLMCQPKQGLSSTSLA